MSVAETVELGIDELRAHPRNPRVHDLDTIKASLERHGQFRAIVAQRARGQQKRHTLLAGHGTWKAAKELGHQTVLVHLLDVDDDAAKRILLVDNRANDKASYDDHALAVILGELPELDATGFDGRDLKQLEKRLVQFEAQDGGSETIPESFDVLVSCGSERAQAELLERLAAEGLTCRALIS